MPAEQSLLIYFSKLGPSKLCLPCIVFQDQIEVNDDADWLMWLWECWRLWEDDEEDLKVDDNLVSGSRRYCCCWLLMFCLFLGKEKDWGPIITLLIMTLSIVARDFLSFRLQSCKRGGFFSPERKGRRGWVIVMVVYVGNRVCLQNPCHWGSGHGAISVFLKIQRKYKYCAFSLSLITN